MRQSIAMWMAIIASGGWVGNLLAAEALPPANLRFAADTQEIPSFQRHVLPLMGRLGCNGRACHGSFQGQGGFRLSLFGYDFKLDHAALLQSEKPRVDLEDVPESLMLLKASLETPHKGGKRMEVDSWEYKLLSRWIQSGAKGVEDDDIGFERLEISPPQIIFTKPGETVQLQVTAIWRDGQREDVTPLCRFRTNDESVSEISASGSVLSLGAGDTHIVAFYDNGIAPVQTLLPVSNQIGPNYPAVPTPTKVDELVVQKLKTLGMIPSEFSTDAEFLRRVSLDVTGTLPAPTEVEAFLSDSSADKRARKIDELLARPAYAAWWATRMSDVLGNNPVNFLDGNNGSGQRSATLWYTWLETRLRNNMPYDKIIEGLLVANSRKAGQSYEDFLAEMAAAYRKDSPTDLNAHESVPYFWERRTFNQPPERSMAVAYAFLGVRLQCAQCHKHPFDQWTQDDFNQFTNFFGRVVYREPADKESRARYNELQQVVKKDAKNKGKNLLAEGQPFPFREVYVQKNDAVPRKGNDKNQKKPKVTQSVTARALGEDQISLNGDVDPRQLLMNWLRERDNPYFAKAFVNRVWAGYFGVGIIEPADDLNLANPPSNAALLTYLEQGFLTNGYDIKWLHREIANSRTYQLSWRTNETNVHDNRNFSHSIPRRLPAEVAVDAIQLALATDEQLAKWVQNPAGRTISKTDGFVRNRGNADYALGIFGRPARLTNCDCERSPEPSLLQSIYLRNDGEMFRKLNDSGWLKELDQRLGVAATVGQRGQRQAERMAQQGKVQRRALKKGLEKTEALITQLKAGEQTPEKLTELATAEKALAAQRVKFQQLKVALPEVAPEPGVEVVVATTPENKLSDADWDGFIRNAYLRTVSRPPTAEELQRSKQYITESEQTSTGMRDLVWALLNTKEFIVNH